MGIFQPQMPYSFIRGRVRVSWRDIYFGLAKELLAIEAAQEFANERGGDIDPPPWSMAELASGKPGLAILELVQSLARSEAKISEAEISDRWLYLALAWIYEQRHDLTDPLQCVEEVYATFEYPEQIAPFVRYMPMVGPDLGGREANEQRMFDRWKQWLDGMAEVYAH